VRRLSAGKGEGECVGFGMASGTIGGVTMEETFEGGVGAPWMGAL
jgi:hypothetical protein